MNSEEETWEVPNSILNILSSSSTPVVSHSKAYLPIGSIGKAIFTNVVPSAASKLPGEIFEKMNRVVYIEDNNFGLSIVGAISLSISIGLVVFASTSYYLWTRKRNFHKNWPRIPKPP